MGKTLTLLVFVSLAVSIYGQSGSCPKQICSASGAPCGRPVGNETTLGQCPNGQYCSPHSYTCKGKVAAGGACDATEGYPCVEHYYCGTSSTCVRMVDDAYPGEACDEHINCIFTSDSGSLGNCTNGRCSAIPVGGTCDNNYAHQCTNGSFCKSSVCTPLQVNGQACIDNKDCLSGQCIPTAVSLAAEGNCGGIATVLSGGACDNSHQCAEGLYCTAPYGTDSFGSCQSALKSSFKKCDPYHSGNCNFPEVCRCDSQGNSRCVAPSPAYRVGYKAAQQALAKCTEKTGCSSTPACQKSCVEESCNFADISRPISTIDWKDEILTLSCKYDADTLKFVAMCTSINPPTSSTLPPASGSTTSESQGVTSSASKVIPFAGAVMVALSVYIL